MANAVKEIDFARAKRVRAEQVENESIVSLLVRLGMVSERAMAQALAETLPLAMADAILRVAMSDPTQSFAIHALEMACDAKVLPCIAVKADIQEALQRLYAGPGNSERTQEGGVVLGTDEDVERLRDMASEDPVEYNLEGINQIQVNSSICVNFSGTLRSIVRQDPDVIMVGGCVTWKL